MKNRVLALDSSLQVSGSIEAEFTELWLHFLFTCVNELYCVWYDDMIKKRNQLNQFMHFFLFNETELQVCVLRPDRAEHILHCSTTLTLILLRKNTKAAM